MKSVIIVFFLAFFALSSSAYSQTTMDAVKIQDLDVEYVEIVGHIKGFTGNVKIYLDYGKVGKAFQQKEMRVVDENNQTRGFGSMVGALNFMSENGYDFVNAYPIYNPTTKQTAYHYLLRKRKE